MQTWPSWQLVGAIFGVDVISTLFCVFGWLCGDLGEASDPVTKNVLLSRNGHTSVVTVIIVWLYSIAVITVIAIAYFLLNKIAWLDNLGRVQRSASDTHMENILGHLTKLAVEH